MVGDNLKKIKIILIVIPLLLIIGGVTLVIVNNQTKKEEKEIVEKEKTYSNKDDANNKYYKTDSNNNRENTSNKIKEIHANDTLTISNMTLKSNSKDLNKVTVNFTITNNGVDISNQLLFIVFSDSNGDDYTTIYTIEKLNTGESIELKEETTNKIIDAVDYRFHIGQFNPQG